MINSVGQVLWTEAERLKCVGDMKLADSPTAVEKGRAAEDQQTLFIQAVNFQPGFVLVCPQKPGFQQ